MKQLYALICFFIVISCNSVSYSQGLSAGFLSGINFSDIHGNYCSGKWKYKSGASESIFIDYSINKVIGFQTGVNIATLYYEHVQYNELPRMYYLSPSSSSYYIPDLIYFRTSEKMDFTVLTIPAQVKLSIPSRPSVNLTAGIFYSFITDYSLNYVYSDEPSKRDFGWLFSTGLSYPLNDNMDALFDIRYMTGRRRFIEQAGYKHGSVDLRFGVAFKGFLSKNSDSDQTGKNDTVSSRISLTYKGGINISRNYFGDNSGSYSFYTGLSAGFSVNIKLAERTFFQTGLSFENTGYSLKDSSDSFHRYHSGLEPVYYVNTKIGTDYINIPAQLCILVGKPGNMYISTGPYLAIKLNARCTGEAIMESKDQGSYSLRKIVVYDDLNGLIRNNDIGWIFGGGITIPVFEKYSLDLGLQYRTGFRDIFNESFYSGMTPYKRGETIIRNRMLSFHFGVRTPVFR